MLTFILSILAWVFLIGAFVSLGWLVRRIIDRDRLVSEVEAYGRPVEDEGLPDLQKPVGAVLGLLALGMVADLFK